MGLNIKKIFDTVTDLVPLGGVAKSLVKGAGSLLFKKAAKVVGIKEETIDKVFMEADKLAEHDFEIKKALIQEEKEKRMHELSVFGRFAELDPGSQKLRSRVRPVLSLGLIGMFMLYGLVYLFQQMFPYLLGMEFALTFPPELVKISLWVVGFWFGGRTVEKGMSILKNGK